MSNLRKIRVGIIAEDISDVNAVKILIRRIKNRDNIGIKKFVGQGNGRILKKCRSWASILKIKGCHSLILIHDLDKKDLDELRKDLMEVLLPCPINKYLICIPIEEIEAWWLSDPEGIKTALNLTTVPNVRGNPQNISSPKEHLSTLVKRCSKNTRVFINTKHNERIAATLNIAKIMKCPSFIPFFNFVNTQI